MNRDRAAARTWTGIALLFLSLGFGFGSWVVRIPEIQARAGLDKAALGAALMAVTAGALAGMPLAGRLGATVGSGRIGTAAAGLLGVGVVLVANARTWWQLAAVLVLLGLSNGALGVSMNGQASQWEQARGRAGMSTFHGVFSVGALLGAASSGAAVAAGVPPRVHLFAVGTGVVAMAVVAGPRLIRPSVRPAPSRATAEVDTADPRRAVNALVVAGSATAFCALFTEGMVADWSAVYLRRDLHAGGVWTGAGYALFATGMAVGRFTGDAAVRRWGGPATLLAACAVSLGGSAALVGVAAVPAALTGFALLGLGGSVVFPTVLSQAAGSVRPDRADKAISTVSTVGYAGFLVGPPAIGALAEAATLRLALTLVVVGAGLQLAITLWTRRGGAGGAVERRRLVNLSVEPAE